MPFSVLRGELDGYLFSQTVTGSPTAQTLFSGAAQVVTPYPFTDPDARSHQRASMFIVPVDTPGGPTLGRAVAVEPMTAPANAFNTGAGLRWLEPGETWTVRWGIRHTGLAG